MKILKLTKNKAYSILSAMAEKFENLGLDKNDKSVIRTIFTLYPEFRQDEMINFLYEEAQ